MRELGVAPAGCTAAHVLALSKMHVRLICMSVLAAMLHDDSSFYEAVSPNKLALAAELHSRGVFAQICVMAHAASWTCSGSNRSDPPLIVLESCAAFGLSAAGFFLERMCFCAWRSMGALDGVIHASLAVALANGSQSPAAMRLHARGVAASLLSYAAAGDAAQRAKEYTVQDGALVWLLSVAAAEDTYAEFIRGRAIACAGNCARAARHVAELEPFVTHMLGVIRAHVLDPSTTLPRIISVKSSPLYCATFAIHNLVAIEELRPLLLEEADVRRLISKLDALARSTPKLKLVAAVIAERVRPAMAQPTLFRLRRSNESFADQMGAIRRALRGAAPLEGAPAPAGFGLPPPAGPDAPPPAGPGAPPHDAMPSPATAPQPAPMPAPPSPRQRTCGGCGATGSTDELKLCAACKRVRYCSAACQARAWPQHKQECTARARGEE